MGVFNCQGAGSWPMKSKETTPTHIRISGKVKPMDVEFLEDVAGENWNGDCAVYAFNSGTNYNKNRGVKWVGQVDRYNHGLFQPNPNISGSVSDSTHLVSLFNWISFLLQLGLVPGRSTQTGPFYNPKYI